MSSQFEHFTCSSSRKKTLSLNLATSKNASLTSRGDWSLGHAPSQQIIHRSIAIKFVAFALVPVFLAFFSDRSGCKAFKVHVVPLENLV